MDTPSKLPRGATVQAPRGQESGAGAQVLLDLLGQMGSWEPFCGPTGAHLWRVPGSDGKTYVLSDRSCTCPSDEYRRGTMPCKHRQALQSVMKVISAHTEHWRAIIDAIESARGKAR